MKQGLIILQFRGVDFFSLGKSNVTQVQDSSYNPKYCILQKGNTKLHCSFYMSKKKFHCRTIKYKIDALLYLSRNYDIGENMLLIGSSIIPNKHDTSDAFLDEN